ncbi:WecB/TagA/CpsF family glycosyltransferase [Colwellia sp. BRX8-9]|uniref:WecB/TagA/CpsF family glycosyltransferase n=1 Tax=Colwellia sp. BRX8-9 TaxID=2759831 RepID=UPI0015F46A56|nr:WecB/TagA/CpsF family glycosyltransferase [Colwellia sp. BRX8-9]MBA6349451.1 WecB/TagA/CpsF family glycosyltransferase [Colwellia sp. BRX8-9]
MFTFIKEKIVNVEEMLINNEKGSVIYLNPSTYNYFRKNMDLIENVDGVRFDGIFMSSFLKLFGINVPKRQSFDMTSLAPQVFEKAEKEGLTLFFCGGADEDVNKFCQIIQSKYKNLQIAGKRNGYFSDDDFSKVKDEIIKDKPDIVILGLGGRKQEVVASKLTPFINGYIFTCGAFISQTTKRIDFYPKYINRLNLRWAYRFIVEPRTIKRVLISYPSFVVYLFIDFINYKNRNQ